MTEEFSILAVLVQSFRLFFKRILIFTLLPIVAYSPLALTVSVATMLFEDSFVPFFIYVLLLPLSPLAITHYALELEKGNTVGIFQSLRAASKALIPNFITIIRSMLDLIGLFILIAGFVFLLGSTAITIILLVIAVWYFLKVQCTHCLLFPIMLAEKKYFSRAIRQSRYLTQDNKVRLFVILNICPIIICSSIFLLFGLESSFSEESIQSLLRTTSVLWYMGVTFSLYFSLFPIFITVSYILLRNELDEPDVEKLDKPYENEDTL